MKAMMRIFLVMVLVAGFFVGCASPTRILIPNPNTTDGDGNESPLVEAKTYDPVMVRALGEFFMDYQKGVNTNEENAMGMTTSRNTDVNVYIREDIDKNNSSGDSPQQKIAKKRSGDIARAGEKKEGENK